jgi:hypothetical protein
VTDHITLLPIRQPQLKIDKTTFAATVMAGQVMISRVTSDTGAVLDIVSQRTSLIISSSPHYLARTHHFLLCSGFHIEVTDKPNC